MDDSAIRETVVIVAGPRWPRTEAVEEFATRYLLIIHESVIQGSQQCA